LSPVAENDRELLNGCNFGIALLDLKSVLLKYLTISIRDRAR